MKNQGVRGVWMKHDKGGRRNQSKRWAARSGPVTITQLDRCLTCQRFHRGECASSDRSNQP